MNNNSKLILDSIQKYKDDLNNIKAEARIQAQKCLEKNFSQLEFIQCKFFPLRFIIKNTCIFLDYNIYGTQDTFTVSFLLSSDGLSCAYLCDNSISNFNDLIKALSDSEYISEKYSLALKDFMYGGAPIFEL